MKTTMRSSNKTSNYSSRWCTTHSSTLLPFHSFAFARKRIKTSAKQWQQCLLNSQWWYLTIVTWCIACMQCMAGWHEWWHFYVDHDWDMNGPFAKYQYLRSGYSHILKEQVHLGIPRHLIRPTRSMFVPKHESRSTNSFHPPTRSMSIS
jgi:hypothetical protein